MNKQRTRARHLANIYRLGVKELWSLWRDPMMILLIVYVFTAAVYTAATAMPETLHKAPIAIVDEDDSPLSQRIVSAFYPPQFIMPQMISMSEMDEGMDDGRFTFALYIPQGFQRDVLAGRAPDLQLNVDATRMSQAFSGSGAVQQIVIGEVNEFVQRQRGGSALPVDLALRARFNPALEKSWFGGVMQIVNYIAMLSIVLTGSPAASRTVASAHAVRIPAGGRWGRVWRAKRRASASAASSASSEPAGAAGNAARVSSTSAGMPRKPIRP